MSGKLWPRPPTLTREAEIRWKRRASQHQSIRQSSSSIEIGKVVTVPRLRLNFFSFEISKWRISSMDRKGAATYLFQAFVRSHRVKWHCYLDEENERRDLLMGNYAASSLHFQTISDDISNRRCFNARLEWNGTFACLGDIWKSSCRDTRCLSQEAFDVRLLVTQNATRNTLLQARSKLRQPRAIARRANRVTTVDRASLFSRKWRMQRVRQRNVWEEGARNKRKERIQEVR